MSQQEHDQQWCGVTDTHAYGCNSTSSHTASLRHHLVVWALSQVAQRSLTLVAEVAVVRAQHDRHLARGAKDVYESLTAPQAGNQWTPALVQEQLESRM